MRHYQGMLFFKPWFLLFRLSKYYYILWKHSFYIGYCDILNKFETVAYFPCFKERTLELLQLLRGHRAILSYLSLKFAHFSHEKATFFYIRMVN